MLVDTDGIERGPWLYAGRTDAQARLNREIVKEIERDIIYRRKEDAVAWMTSCHVDLFMYFDVNNENGHLMVAKENHTNTDLLQRLVKELSIDVTPRLCRKRIR